MTSIAQLSATRRFTFVERERVVDHRKIAQRLPGMGADHGTPEFLPIKASAVEPSDRGQQQSVRSLSAVLLRPCLPPLLG